MDPAREAIYTVGYSIGIGTIFDCTTLCYDFAGNRLWLDRYIGEGGNGNDAGQAIYVDSSGNIIVAGYTTRVGTGKDILVIKYPPTGPGLEEARGAKPATTIRVVPTVARNVCRFNVPSGTTSLTIADAAGRAVCALPCAGATWLAWDCRDAAGFLVTNGVYFVTAQTLSGSSTAKFLIRR